MLTGQIFKMENLVNLDRDDPRYLQGKDFESQFTLMVDGMRRSDNLPIPSINMLMELFWNLVGNRVVPSAITEVPSLSFYAEVRPHKSVAMVLCPENWLTELAKDPYYQMGALVFAASQAKDYWNQRFSKQEKNAIHARAWSYEAELLFFFSANATHIGFKPNSYQQKIMSQYPNGVASEASHYVGRDYDGVFPPFPVIISDL